MGWNCETGHSPRPLSLCQPHSPSKHSKNQLCWNEFNPLVSTVTPSAHLRAPGGAEAWLMTWPLHGPRMTSSWGSRHLARRNSQRDVNVLPSEAQRGLRGAPLHSMLHSLSWSTRRNYKGEKAGDKQRKRCQNLTIFGRALHKKIFFSTLMGVILERICVGSNILIKTGYHTRELMQKRVSVTKHTNC